MSVMPSRDISWNAVVPKGEFDTYRDQLESLGAKIFDAHLEKFGDGEERVWVDDSSSMNPRLETVIFYSSKRSSDGSSVNIFALFMLLDVVKRICTGKVYIVAPYLPYSRQDRCYPDGYPISAKVVAHGLSRADAIFTMDLHSEQLQGFYNVPVINISVRNWFSHFITALSDGNITLPDGTVVMSSNVVIVAPDAGGLKRAHAVASAINIPLVIKADKRRDGPGQVKILDIIGDVKGKTCFIVDDIVDGGSTLILVAEALQAKGAKYIAAFVTHPVLSGNALEKLAKSCISNMVFTNSIPLPPGTPVKAIGTYPTSHEYRVGNDAISLHMLDASSLVLGQLMEYMRK